MDQHQPQPRAFRALCSQALQIPKDRGPDFAVNLSRVMPPSWARSLTLPSPSLWLLPFASEKKLAPPSWARSHKLLVDSPQLPLAQRKGDLAPTISPSKPSTLKPNDLSNHCSA